jgi:uncharacterized protein (DUF362 family)/Pyruvate/2-oxoacid:ferredoxin oxidoreductase delta subunit
MPNQQYKKSQMVTVQKATYSNLDINKLLAPMGGIQTIVQPNERVVLKVNLLSASSPGSAVVTHPVVVRAVAEAVLSVGGIPVVADSPSREFTKGRLDKVYEAAGLKELAADLGIELNYDTGSKTVPVVNGKKLKKVPICNFILNADKVIALPKLKTHSLTILTLATKIMYGAVPGLTKARYHSMYFRKPAFANMLLDVLSVAKPDLFIMDGIVGMQGDGPFGGNPVELDLALASKDAVAMDLAVCEILNINPVGIPTLKRAKIRKLWPGEIEYPLLTPTEARYNGFILPSTAGYLLTGHKQPRKSPVVIQNCTACGDCKEICQEKAITVQNKTRAIIDYDHCIRCYCCHEVCPERAIKLKTLK